MLSSDAATAQGARARSGSDWTNATDRPWRHQRGTLLTLRRSHGHASPVVVRRRRPARPLLRDVLIDGGLGRRNLKGLLATRHPQPDRPTRLLAPLEPRLHIRPHVPPIPPELDARHCTRPCRLPHPRHRHAEPRGHLVCVQQALAHAAKSVSATRRSWRERLMHGPVLTYGLAPLRTRGSTA
jgi:hypothetical protein